MNKSAEDIRHTGYKKNACAVEKRKRFTKEGTIAVLTQSARQMICSFRCFGKVALDRKGKGVSRKAVLPAGFIFGFWEFIP